MSAETSGFDLYSCSSCAYSSDYCSESLEFLFVAHTQEMVLGTCSMHTTPHRRSVSDAGVTVGDIKAELQRDISERFVDDKLDVIEFVRHVWGLSSMRFSTPPKILNQLFPERFSTPTGSLSSTSPG